MTTMYTVDEIRDAYCDIANPDPKFLRDLIYHIEMDSEPCKAMSVAADFALIEATPYVANHLGHKKRDVRESAAGKLCRLLANDHPDIDMYAAKLYHVAKYDDDVSNRALIAGFTGRIIDLFSPNMRNQFAELLLSYAQLTLDIKFAYQGMLKSMDEKYESGDMPPMYPDFVDVDKVQRFRDKYNI